MKVQNDTDALKDKFMSLFSEELQKRKDEYFEAKEKKDLVFQELEHLKTSSRLLETRMKKKVNAKDGVSYPLKLEIGITHADLHQNKDSILGNEYEEDLKIYYKVDNGKENFRSSKATNVLHPSWDDIFSLEMQDSKERLYFQVFVRVHDEEKSERKIDTFDISASIIEQNLKTNDELTDNITTAASNHFTLNIKGKIDVNPKLQNYRNKIDKNEALFREVEPPYLEARSRFEKFLNLKGVELLEEWAILGSDFNLHKKRKAGKQENDSRNEESKILELNMDHLDQSFLGSSMKQKRRAKTFKKPIEKKATHSFKKKEDSVDFDTLGTVTQLTLEDIGEIHTPEKEEVKPKIELKSNAPDDHVKRRIEKKHLHKPYKTAAIIPERDELSDDSPSKPEDAKAAHKLTPSQQIIKDETGEYPNNFSSTQKLTSDMLRTSNLGAKRSGLGTSLINFAMEDLTHTNKVKSVYNQNATMTPLKVGSMFKAMDVSNTLSGMLMMNNSGMGMADGQRNMGIGAQVMNYNPDEDNCSLISGYTFQTFQNYANPMMPFGRKPFGP